MKAWEDVDAKMHQILSGITFAELVDRMRKKRERSNGRKSRGSALAGPTASWPC